MVVPHGVDAPAADAAPTRRAPAPVRPRRPPGARVPGDHPSAQASRLPRRSARRAVGRPDLLLVLLGGRGAGRRRVTEADRPRRRRQPCGAPGPGARRRPRRADRAGRGAGVPLGVRGLRRAGARGDGARHAGGVQRPRRPARSRRRRRRRAPADDRWLGRRRSTRWPPTAPVSSPAACAAPRCSRRRRRAAPSTTPTGGPAPILGREIVRRTILLVEISSRGRGLRIVVVCPHFGPDTAPTGTVMTRIVDELAARGHSCTSSPPCRGTATTPSSRDGGWPVGDRERTAWGSITRVNPFPGGDKRNLAAAGPRLRRVLGARRGAGLPPADDGAPTP